MSKIPKDPKEIFQELTEDYKDCFGDELVSIILYGSAVGEDYRPGKSDINVMIVLTDAGIEDLDRAHKVVSKWQKRRVAIPLFLTEAYIATSTDVFPIEYLNFQRNHVLVHGKDVLNDLTFNPEHVRLQCEREIKGKLLLLREAFLETSGKGRPLRDVISHSIGAFMAIFRAMLFLKEVTPPGENRDLIRAAGEACGLETQVFERLLDVKEQRIKINEAELRSLYKDYLSTVRHLSRFVDEMGG
ncbi:MAG: hypothetical protein JRJ85_21635 [Deltaproteobacteria bacterium]|nr:hypothetical protein [Deltaproteobacteria bacterium]